MNNDLTPLSDEAHAKIQEAYANVPHVDGETGKTFPSYQDYLDFENSKQKEPTREDLQRSLAALKGGMDAIPEGDTAGREKQQAAIDAIQKQLD